jgi:hypothetical protein
VSSISALRAEELACLERIRELNERLESLAEFRSEVTRSRARFQDQLDSKVNTARRAGDMPYVRTAKRYSEHTVNYLTGEFSQSMEDGFSGVDSQVDVVTRQTEDELDHERARLSSIRDAIAAEEARERAERARREAEARQSSQ